MCNWSQSSLRFHFLLGIQACYLLASGLFEGRMSLRSVIVIEWTAWAPLIEVRRKFLRDLKYSGDWAEGRSEVQFDACEGGLGASGGVSTEFERDQSILFEIVTLDIARVQGTTPSV